MNENEIIESIKLALPSGQAVGSVQTTYGNSPSMVVTIVPSEMVPEPLEEQTPPAEEPAPAEDAEPTE